MKIVVAIYNPPELFPPTLWAVQELSKTAESITIVTRNIAVEPWTFAGNVSVIRIGSETKLNQPLPFYKKIADFARFCLELKRAVRSSRNNGKLVCLAYDTLALYAFHLTLRGRKRKRSVFWFHSHDVLEKRGLSWTSVNWWAARNEARAISRTNLFTLPSQERLDYYELKDYKGKVRIIPNFPSRKFVESLSLSLPELRGNQPIKLIYQGSISAGHCLETIMEAMNMDDRLELTLIGWCYPDYRSKLEGLIGKLGIRDRVHFVDPVPYHKLYPITAAHHIGLAIHKPENIIYSTGGRASNKIYEYASVGLPVMLYDNEHYREYCSDFKWAAFTDGTPSSILKCVSDITANYKELSIAAKQDFKQKLNYEHTFDKFAETELKG